MEEEAKKVLGKSPAGRILLGVFAGLAALALLLSNLSSISKETGVSIQWISSGVLFIVAAISLVWLQRCCGKAQPTIVSNPIADENRDRIGELLRIEIGSISIGLNHSIPRMEIRVEFLNMSVFQARIRKVVYDILSNRGTGSPVHTIVKNRSFDREMPIGRQRGTSFSDSIDLSPALVKVIAEAVEKSKQYSSGVPFDVKITAYVLFEWTGLPKEKEIHATPRFTVPHYEVQ